MSGSPVESVGRPRAGWRRAGPRTGCRPSSSPAMTAAIRRVRPLVGSCLLLVFSSILPFYTIHVLHILEIFYFPPNGTTWTSSQPPAQYSGQRGQCLYGCNWFIGRQTMSPTAWEYRNTGSSHRPVKHTLYYTLCSTPTTGVLHACSTMLITGIQAVLQVKGRYRRAGKFIYIVHYSSMKYTYLQKNYI